jgi:hypothetical protein
MDEIIYSILSTYVTTYPVQAPSSITRPYAAYTSDYYDNEKAFEGYLKLTSQRFEVDLVGDSLATLRTLFRTLRTALKNIERTTQSGRFIERVDIDPNSPEFWEDEINAYRKILTFEIGYQE